DIMALFRSPANRREIEVRKIGVGPFRGIRFPEDLELTAMHGERQARREEAMIVFGLNPDRALRGIVAMIRRRTTHGINVRRAGAADGARQQHDADIGRLPCARGLGVGPLTGLPAPAESAVFGVWDALKIGGWGDPSAASRRSDQLEL